REGPIDARGVPEAAACTARADPPRGWIATIFRWTRRSPQDLAPRRSAPAREALHQVAPASSGLSLGRSRWSVQVACAFRACPSLKRHEAMKMKEPPRSNRPAPPLRHTSRMSKPLFSLLVALCLAACATPAPRTAAPPPSAAPASPTVL